MAAPCGRRRKTMQLGKEAHGAPLPLPEDVTTNVHVNY